MTQLFLSLIIRQRKRMVITKKIQWSLKKTNLKWFLTGLREMTELIMKKRRQKVKAGRQLKLIIILSQKKNKMTKITTKTKMNLRQPNKKKEQLMKKGWQLNSLKKQKIRLLPALLQTTYKNKNCQRRRRPSQPTKKKRLRNRLNQPSQTCKVTVLSLSMTQLMKRTMTIARL